MPGSQVKQSVCARLQPFGQLVVVTPQTPVALQMAALVLVTPVQDAPGPHGVFGCLFPDSMQAIKPVEQLVVPFLHGFGGAQV